MGQLTDRDSFVLLKCDEEDRERVHDSVTAMGGSSDVVMVYGVFDVLARFRAGIDPERLRGIRGVRSVLLLAVFSPD